MIGLHLEDMDNLMMRDTRSAFQRGHLCAHCIHRECLNCTGKCDHCGANCICEHKNMKRWWEVCCPCGYAELCYYEYTAKTLAAHHEQKGPKHEVTVQRLNSSKEIS